MQKEKFLLDKMNIIFQIFLIIILILVEIFDFVTHYLYELFPFKRRFRIFKVWFKKRSVYKTYKKLVKKALSLDDNSFLWLILFMSILALPFIYLFPFYITNVGFKIGSIVVGKLISSSTTTLIALGSDKLLRIDFINKAWSLVKDRYAQAKLWFLSLTFVQKFKKFKDENKSIFMEKLKYFSSKIKEKSWRKAHLSRVWSWFEK